MTLTSKVYEDLSEAIIEGRYHPDEKLKADHIKAQYGVSAATVREALNRLLSDGLVVVYERRGFAVAPFSAEDLADIIRARLLIEVECVTDAVAEGGADWEASLVAAYHHLKKAEEAVKPSDKASLIQLEKCNSNFHTALVEGCTSATLKDFCRKLFVRHYRYRRLAQQNTQIITAAQGDHKGLLDAALAHDAAAAAKIIRDHITRPQLHADDLKAVFEAG